MRKINCDEAKKIDLIDLNVIKDQDGNIVKTYQYHYLGQPGN